MARSFSSISRNDILDIINSDNVTSDHIQFLEQNLHNRDPMFIRHMAILIRRICQAREHINEITTMPGMLDFILDALSRGISIAGPMASALSWMLLLCPEWGRYMVLNHPDIIESMVKVNRGISDEYAINFSVVLDKYSDIIPIDNYVPHMVGQFFTTSTPYVASRCAIVLMKASQECVDRNLASYHGTKEISVGKRLMPDIVKFMETYSL